MAERLNKKGVERLNALNAFIEGEEKNPDWSVPGQSPIYDDNFSAKREWLSFLRVMRAGMQAALGISVETKFGDQQITLDEMIDRGRGLLRGPILPGNDQPGNDQERPDLLGR